MTAYEIQALAYAAFDAWLARQSDEVQDLGLIEQIRLYDRAPGACDGEGNLHLAC